jgi:hypothetical protein
LAFGYRLPMARMMVALVLLAACGSKVPYQCTVVVSGTGTASDGTYTCDVPPSALYTPSTQRGSIQAFASTAEGELFTLNVTMNGTPSAGTYADASLPPGGVYTAILSSSNADLWQADTGSGAFSLTITSMNAKASLPTTQVWSGLSGHFTATLPPLPNNPATSHATVTMNF